MNCGQRLVYMAPGKSAIAGWLAGKKKSPQHLLRGQNQIFHQKI